MVIIIIVIMYVEVWSQKCYNWTIICCLYCIVSNSDIPDIRISIRTRGYPREEKKSIFITLFLSSLFTARKNIDGCFKNKSNSFHVFSVEDFLYLYPIKVTHTDTDWVRKLRSISDYLDTNVRYPDPYIRFYIFNHYTSLVPNV